MYIQIGEGTLRLNILIIKRFVKVIDEEIRLRFSPGFEPLTEHGLGFAAQRLTD